jgi:hypothetical protein
MHWDKVKEQPDSEKRALLGGLDAHPQSNLFELE